MKKKKLSIEKKRRSHASTKHSKIIFGSKKVESTEATISSRFLSSVTIRVLLVSA